MPEPKKILTLMILPFNNRGIKTCNLSHRFLQGLAIALAVHVLALAYFGVQYVVQGYHIRQIETLETQNAHLKSQLPRTHDRLVLIRDQVDYLTGVDLRLRAWTDMSEPGPETRQMGVGGGEEIPSTQNILDSETHTSLFNAFREMDQLTRETGFLKTSFDTLSNRLQQNETHRRHFPSILPVPEHAQNQLGSPFGHRIHPITLQREFHNGLDISGRRGTDVLATADGVVEKVARDKRLGYYITLQHGFGYRTLYGHLQSLPKLKSGQKVQRGDVIGNLGSTGWTTGPHVHYSVFQNGHPTDPHSFILKNQRDSIY
ncbi:MAG: M23 family metallopeptidase [bacterium]|nr:M23 family metallopeptidase [bacterium]